MRPLILGAGEIEALRALREQAAANVVDVRTLGERLADPAGKEAHMAQMTRQSLSLPVGFFVTYSVEIGHPCGACRHLSMSVAAEDKLPHPEAVRTVAKAMGFTGNLPDWVMWMEDLQGHGRAVNVVEPIASVAGGRA